MNRTNIEYLDYTWNPYTGCWNWQNGICGGGGKDFRCWAKTQTERFKNLYPKGFEPTFYPKRLLEPLEEERPARIGVCFMGDLGGDWVDPLWVETILTVVRYCSDHTFVFLTKCPWNLPKWNPWPANAEVGASATNADMAFDAINNLEDVQASVRFISFEPLLSPINLVQLDVHLKDAVNGIIIGAATNPLILPELEWVQELVEVAEVAEVQVFLKDNLLGSPEIEGYYPFFCDRDGFPLHQLRQELPRWNEMTAYKRSYTKGRRKR